MAALRKHRKAFEHRGFALGTQACIAYQVGAEAQIVRNALAGEVAPLLRDIGDAASNALFRREGCNVLAAEHYVTCNRLQIADQPKNDPALVHAGGAHASALRQK